MTGHPSSRNGQKTSAPRPGTRKVVAALAAVLAGALIGLSDRARAAEDVLPVAKPEEVGMSSARLQRIDETMQRYIDANLLAGTVTLVARHGKVVHFEAQGFRDKDAAAPMSIDAIFTIMSMTKPIVSTALMMLFEEGRFLLDDPISKWLPGYQDKQVRVSDGARERLVPAARPITVRHLLTHTSGLSLRAPGPSFGGAGGATDGRQERPRTVDDAIARAADVPLAFQPGDHWQYGASTDYVALLVEKIAGLSLDEFLKTRVFEPLGMHDTHYNIPAGKIDRVAAVYRPSGPGNTIELFRAPRVAEPTMYFGGQAGLNSTAADYFRFQQMMLNGGELNGVRLLSPRTVNLMISNHIGDDKLVYVRGPGYGFGLGYGILMDPGKANEHLSPGSFMWGGAWGTISWVDPVEDMLGVLMTQVTSYAHLNHRLDFSTVASQAIVETARHVPPKVMGYQVLR